MFSTKSPVPWQNGAKDFTGQASLYSYPAVGSSLGHQGEVGGIAIAIAQAARGLSRPKVNGLPTALVVERYPEEGTAVGPGTRIEFSNAGISVNSTVHGNDVRAACPLQGIAPGAAGLVVHFEIRAGLRLCVGSSKYKA